MNQTFGLSHFWAQGDVVSHTVACILLGMSIASWYYIVTKGLMVWRLRQDVVNQLESFWVQPRFDVAVAQLVTQDPLRIFAPLAQKTLEVLQKERSQPTLTSERGEILTRTLRHHMNLASAKLENGLTLLASMGSVSPFVGLFGTVWGIYHALLGISGAQAIALDQIAGPVGEALIMTAAGIFVAIPAVLAFNGFSRVNRLLLAELDGFAHDLYSHFSTPVAPSASA
jgi:biopolymer transport protein ExbB